jgi:hypothetical protein
MARLGVRGSARRDVPDVCGAAWLGVRGSAWLGMALAARLCAARLSAERLREGG